MPLFQQSVIKKHIESFDVKHIEERWQLFRGIFHTAEKQQNIRNSKEEQYQEGFLRDLFVTVLGYTINPEVNFNLLTEQKNVNNSKKADGAILMTGSNGMPSIVAVIELKGTETTDLNKIEIQAFGYKNNQPGCNYVITSNFEKLRFYIDNTTQQEEFNLFTLTKAQFELLYACLAWESISKNTPMQILNESVSKENIITKSLYKDYSEFKRALFANLVEMNPQFDKLILFKKTQKLLDRFLFIFFAEDRGLLPTNLIFRINKEWEEIIAKRMQVSLYDRYKMYFNDLNVGAKVTLPAFGKKTGEAITAEFEIFAYNGGLFQPDDLLDNIQIEDTLLHSYTQKMSHYNFESDVDVNILGHIFENSLNEIDEIKSEIEGNVLEKTKTRRKKDGVFYTPKYITKYIVDNTIGKLCTEKKEEIKLLDEDFISDFGLRVGGSRIEKPKAKKKDLLDKLTDYRNWLLDLTICDPACGSGAFLNQALEFLIAEHRYVDELQAKLLGDSLILSDIENSILERNIYGVDLNDESVEIAKLSLWLRTAQKGRKLNSLNNNIKCGNSLIDDPAVAGDKAFSWEKEFPEVFKEKNKFAYHITTSIHDSRTSQRMIDYHARERRFEGTKPEQEVQYLTKEEEELIASTVSDIVKEDNLNIAAFNLCKDHMHILLVCEEDEVSKIMHKIKGRTARVCNLNKGINNSKETQTNKGINPLDDNRNPLDDQQIPLNETTTKLKDGSTPFWTQKYGCKPITSDQQFWNTVNYIDDNRAKHNLPNNPKLSSTVTGFLKTFEDCFKKEYKGGFDVVIGNPPYVDNRGFDKKELSFLYEKYPNSFKKSGTDKFKTTKLNLIAPFIELNIMILRNQGLTSFIFHKNIFKTNSYTSIREFILRNFNIILLTDWGAGQFQDVIAETATFVLKKEKILNDQIKVEFYKLSKQYLENHQSQKSFLLAYEYIFGLYADTKDRLVIEKIEFNSIGLEHFVNVNNGIVTGNDSKYLSFEKSTINFKKAVRGKDIKKYSRLTENEYVNYSKNELLRARDEKIFLADEKLLMQMINIEFVITYDNQQYYNLGTTYAITNKNSKLINLKYLLCVLNSGLIKFYYLKKFTNESSLTNAISTQNLFNIPIKLKDLNEQKIFIDFAGKMLSLNNDFQSLSNKFSTYFASQYQLDKLPGKLEKWYELEFVDFIKELNKAIKGVKGTPLTKKDEFEWMELFEENKKKALELKSEIDKTDKEIDKMVYELYGLSEEEIKIVEGE